MLNRVKDRIPEAAGIALALILLLTIWVGALYENRSEWVRHTLSVQTKIAQIWSLVQDVEIGQRSFILTGDDRFLQPLIDARPVLEQELVELKRLVSDNSERIAEIDNLRPVIDQRLAFADSTVALRRSGDFEGARQRVLEGQGLRVMQDLRAQFERMLDGEQKLLEARSEKERWTTSALMTCIALAAAGTLGVLVAWIVGQRRSSRDLRCANAALQQTIAEREAAEVQVRQMQKTEAVGQLTGGIAHDFNNMLAIIISGVNLARKRISSNQPGADAFLASAVDGAQRAATLVKRLLAFSRQQPLAPVVLDANKFVAGMSELIARALGETIRMETILGGGLWPSLADPAQLENAILNLCVNARDAMPDGGRLTLETANCHLDDRYVQSHPEVPAGQYILIAVSDTGTGMAPEVAVRAFDPFFTTKEAAKGTGLGLSQVFGFVKQSGGHVKIYSELGQGTTVKIYLPRQYAKQPTAVEAAAAKELSGAETILLVEDDASVLALTAASLRELGYTVIEARHAQAALAHIVNKVPFDLLLTDIVMPDVGGRRLADDAKEMRPDLRVLYMTGFTKNAIVHNGVLDAGVHFLAKPFTFEELSRKVREALDATADLCATGS